MRPALLSTAKKEPVSYPDRLFEAQLATFTP